MKVIHFSLFLFVCFLLNYSIKEFRLSQYSEEYNTHYFYCGNADCINTDTTMYVDDKLPEAFVVEMGPLKEGENTAFVYNDEKELIVSNMKGALRIGDKIIGKIKDVDSKILLYFVNGKMIIYLDDVKEKELDFNLDKNKRIGIRLSKDKGYSCRYFNCYEPIAFNVADYGAALEDGMVKNRGGLRMGLHNVGEAYSLTFPSDITRMSKRSIRFEYKFVDSKNEEAGRMKRARSEISGVFANSPKNKWIIEYDLYVPGETADDKQSSEIITQIHEGSKTPTIPPFCLYIKGGCLGCSIRGDSIEVAQWKGIRKPLYQHSRKLLYLKKNRWYHVKIYLKEGWQLKDMPLTRVWIDDALLFESNCPNCYPYEPENKGKYAYLKFGVYKSRWLTAKKIDQRHQTRTYIFDNFVVKY